jgi:hypothetical protein
MLRLLPCLAISLFAALAPAQTSYFSASLKGEQEVPPTPSTARGFGLVRLDEPANTVSVLIEADIGAATAAHIHRAAAGQNGPVIVTLANASPYPGRWVGTGTLTPNDVALLKSAGLYLNVHSGTFPGGEIRGQLVVATATRFSANLTGAQEVPPNPSTETGAFYAYLYEPDNVLLCEITTSIANARITGAHIHQAPTGQNGPVVFPFANAFPQCLAVELSAAQVATLRAAGFYFNIHTNTFGGGEIRGQIVAGVGDFVAPMSGAQEVPPNPSTAQGEFCVRLTAAGALDYRGTTSPFTTNRTAQHFHAAPRGQNGGVVITVNNPVNNVYTGVTRALSNVEVGQVRAEGWYVNVHTAAFPGGEIRGQVVPAELPVAFGGGCRGSNGKLPVHGALNAPCLNAPFRLTLANATAGRLAAVIFGATRGAPFPLPLDAIGMNRCWLFHDDLGIAVSGTTDGNGCLNVDLPIPFDVTLRGLVLHSSFFAIDPGSTALGVVGSNALQWKVQ